MSVRKAKELYGSNRSGSVRIPGMDRIGQLEKHMKIYGSNRSGPVRIPGMDQIGLLGKHMKLYNRIDWDLSENHMKIYGSNRSVSVGKANELYGLSWSGSVWISAIDRVGQSEKHMKINGYLKTYNSDNYSYLK